jgi:hypothetical protein
MKILKPARVDNATALKLLCQNSAISKPYIQKIGKAYLQYVRRRGRPRALVPLNLPKAVVDELYEFYKSKRKRDGLNWIAKYRRAAGLSHCPLCGNPGPSHLEHYLPRTPYAEFTIFSWNLLPSCGLCNGKRSNHANPPGETNPLIHPYFDKLIYGEPMLSARIVRPLGGVRFEPVAITSFDPPVLQRIERQIKACVDVDRFNNYLVSKWNIWRGKASEYGETARIREELDRELRASVGPTGNNSWDAAFLRAILADNDALDWLAQNVIDITFAPSHANQ